MNSPPLSRNLRCIVLAAMTVVAVSSLDRPPELAVGSPPRFGIDIDIDPEEPLIVVQPRPRYGQVEIDPLCRRLYWFNCCGCPFNCLAFLLVPLNPEDAQRREVPVPGSSCVADCCAGCPPSPPLPPQSCECGVSATNKYSVNTTLCGSANLGPITGQLGLASGWEQATTASCSAQASCTNCNRSSCQGVIVEIIHTYEYWEQCLGPFGGVTSTNVYTIEVIEREPRCQASGQLCSTSPREGQP